MEKHDCLSKVRKELMDDDPTITWIQFGLSNITTMDKSKQRIKKTGQEIFIGFDYTKKDGSILKKPEEALFLMTIVLFVV